MKHVNPKLKAWSERFGQGLRRVAVEKFGFSKIGYNLEGYLNINGVSTKSRTVVTLSRDDTWFDEGAE